MRIRFLIFTALLFLISCSSDKNSQDFINKTQGNYLFNADEKIEVYFNDAVLFVKWRGHDTKALKVNDSTFYVQPLNEKLIFTNNQIQLAKKKEHKDKSFVFTKLGNGEKTPSEYLADGDYEKALKAYQNIKAKDSLNPVIKRRNLDRMGFMFLANNELDKAVSIFKINTVLYPNSSRTFDNLGDVYLKKKDTLSAIENYKKALAINPENRNSKHQLKKLTKK